MSTGFILDGIRAVQRVDITDYDRDGFVWVRTSDDSRTVLRLAPSEVFDTPYLAGRAQGGTTGNYGWRDVADFSDAAASWKGAQNDHAETSYFGAARIREMRGYWLGRLRTVHEDTRAGHGWSM